MVNLLYFVQIVSTPRSNNLDNLFRLFGYRYRDYPFQSSDLSERLEETIWMIFWMHFHCFDRWTGKKIGFLFFYLRNTWGRMCIGAVPDGWTQRVSLSFLFIYSNLGANVTKNSCTAKYFTYFFTKNHKIRCKDRCDPCTYYIFALAVAHNSCPRVRGSNLSPPQKEH